MEPVSVPGESALFHMEESNNQLRLYIPVKVSERYVCMSRALPQGLFKYFGALKYTSSAFLTQIINAPDLDTVDFLLEDAGIISLPDIHRPEGEDVPRPEGGDVPQREGANVAGQKRADVAGPESADVAGPESADVPGPEGAGSPVPEGSNVHQPGGPESVHPTLQPPERPLHRQVRSLSPSSVSMTPSRESGIAEAATPSLSSDISGATTSVTSVFDTLPLQQEAADQYKILLDYVIRGAQSLHTLPDKGQSLLVDQSVTYPANFFIFTALFSEIRGDREFKTGVAGELFVSQKLYLKKMND
jgi:hypothetical protein